MRKIGDDENGDVSRLLGLLETLPPAIKQAAAFMNKKKKSISTYLGVYLATDTDLIENLSHDFEDMGRYSGYENLRNPVAATWSVTFESITEHHLAYTYLCFMFCLS
jgi:hypothetical protein